VIENDKFITQMLVFKERTVQDRTYCVIQNRVETHVAGGWHKRPLGTCGMVP
jgi:hypothetical protein